MSNNKETADKYNKYKGRLRDQFYAEYAEEEEDVYDEYRVSKSNRRQSSDKARAKSTKRWSRESE
jgi:hypothetical protein